MRNTTMNQSKIADLDKAREVLLSGDLEGAERLCNSLLAIEPGQPEALHLLGIVSMMRGRPDDALALLDKAIGGAGFDSVMLSNRAESLRRLGRLREAYEGFEQVLRVDNSNPDAHFNFALVLRAMGDAPRAEHFLRNVLMLNPDMARAHYELAELYRDEGHLEQAETEYRAAIASAEAPQEGMHSISPATLSAWRAALGIHLRESGKLLEAVSTLREATRYDCRDAQTLFELGRASFELCFEAESKQSYIDSVALSPPESAITGGRIVIARMIGLKTWSERNNDTGCRTLARSQWLELPTPRVLSANASHPLPLGKPVTPEILVCRVRKVEILPREFAVLTEQGHVMVDGLVNWPQHFAQKSIFSRFSSDDARLLLDVPSDTLVFDGSCALIGGTGDHFAWMFECLPRLWALEQACQGEMLSLVVPHGLSADRVGMLEAIGIPASRLLRVPDNSVLAAADVVLPSLLTIGDWVSPIALQFLRRSFSMPPQSVRRRLFLQRRDSDRVHLSNEEEIVECLLRHDFEVIDVAEHSPLELMSVLCSAEAIVSVDDEALANLVVAPQGARIGVIVAEGNFRPRCFFMSAQLGHNFTYLVGRSDFNSNPVHALCDIHLERSILLDFLGGR